jgi:hydroxymethylpyrimidine pyrophosphatase-like HAD family hydrolase
LVKLSVIALDFDGTIARNDTLDPDVGRAIGEARARGVFVVLVTGRILSELERVLGDLQLVDAVVAENGAVMRFPASGYTAVLGPPPPDALLDALRRASIPYLSGQSLVDTDASHAERILSIVRGLELPLTLAFNRSRLMVMPQAISKATGLRKALTLLRLSPRNAVAVGDAENDHELLLSCELGVAVAWGSPGLKVAADRVLEGDGPAAVAGLIRHLLEQHNIAVPAASRRRLLLGYGDTGEAVSLAVRGRNLLVAGDSKSGKSWAAGLLCEQLILHGYSLCVIDPEGDYTSLEALPGVMVFGGADPLPKPHDLMKALRHPDVSVVLDLSHMASDAKLDFVRSVLPALAALRRRTGLPHRIVIDEAHYLLHRDEDRELLDLQLNGYTLVTYRASLLAPSVLAAAEAVIVTRESEPAEVQALFALCASCHGATSAAEWASLLGGLVLGDAVLLPITTEARGGPLRVRLVPRLTPHVRHFTKYVDGPIPLSRAFVFSRDGVLCGPKARTLSELIYALERQPAPVLDGHLRRGDFSRWVCDVFGDHALANELRQIEEAHRNSTATEGASAVGRAVRARYDLMLH